MRGMLLNCGFGQQAVTRHALERGEEDFSGPSYFASHNPVKFRRKQDRRNYGCSAKSGTGFRARFAA